MMQLVRTRTRRRPNLIIFLILLLAALLIFSPNSTSTSLKEIYPEPGWRSPPLSTLFKARSHILFLGEFTNEGKYGGVDKFLAGKLLDEETAGRRITIVDVRSSSGVGKRRKDSFERELKWVLRDGFVEDGEDGREKTERLKSIAVRTVFDTKRLEKELRGFLVEAWPEVEGVVLFSTRGRVEKNETGDGNDDALARALVGVGKKVTPWVLKADFSEDEDEELPFIPETVSPLELATHLIPLRLLSLALPPSSHIFGDPFSPRNSFVSSVTHAALGNVPISLPYLASANIAPSGRLFQNNMGVYVEDISTLIYQVINKLKQVPIPKKRQSFFTELELRLSADNNRIDQFDFVSVILDWTRSRSPVSSRPLQSSFLDPFPTFSNSRSIPRALAAKFLPITIKQAKLNQFLGEGGGSVRVADMIDSARSYLTSLLVLQRSYLRDKVEKDCRDHVLSPSFEERRREIERNDGCEVQLLTQNIEEGKWWTIACTQLFGSQVDINRVGSLVGTRAIPTRSGKLGTIGVDIKSLEGSNENWLRFRCPTDSDITTQPSGVGDSSQSSIHGFWNSSLTDGKSGWRDATAWYPSLSESEGFMEDTFKVVVMGDDGEFGLRSEESDRWLGLDSGEEGEEFRKVVFERAIHPTTKFKFSPICCLGTRGINTGTWSLEDDPLVLNRGFKRKQPNLRSQRCSDRKRSLRWTEQLLRSVRGRMFLPLPTSPHPSVSWTTPISTSNPTEWNSFNLPICPIDCQAPIPCLSTLSCRCTNDRCGISKQYKPSSLFDKPIRFSPTPQPPPHDVDLPRRIEMTSMAALVLPLARHAFFSPSLRPHVVDVSTRHVEETGCKRQNHPLDRLRDYSVPLSDCDVVFAQVPQTCSVNSSKLLYETALRRAQGETSRRVTDWVKGTTAPPPSLVLANSLPLGNCFESLPGGRLEDFVPRNRQRTDAINWVTDGSYDLPCFQPGRDVVIPPVSELEPELVKRYGKLSKIVWAGRRKHLAFFKEKIEEGYGALPRTRLGCGVRPNVRGQPSFMYQQLGHRSSYEKSMGDSVFCPIVRGITGQIRHLAEALYSGCIPVLVVDDTQLPFDDILDYTKFSITIPEAHLPNLINILQNYDLEELTDLQVNGIKVRDFFLWRSEQPVGAAIDEGPLRLALVGTRMRVGGTTDGGPLQYRTGGGLFTTPQD